MNEKEEVSNIAFIDGQNLHMGTKDLGWSVDYKKLRTYLRDKYHITEAYYFLGYVSEEEQDLYDSLQKVGFILLFREHSSALKGKKKGNVDSDIVFSAMKKLVENEPFDKIFIVSGDGDFFCLAEYLAQQNKLLHIFAPNKYYSPLFKPYSSFIVRMDQLKGSLEFIQKKTGIGGRSKP